MKLSTPSLQRLFDVVDILVDERVGVIKYVCELPREPGAPDCFHFYAQASSTSAFVAQKNFANAGGASADRSLAMAKAIGEAVERYCSAIYDQEDFPLTSFESAPFRSIPPEEFALHSHEQYQQPGFPYVPFERSTLVRWAPTLDALTGETCHIPASMVYMPYYFDEGDGERPIAQRISTGLACHCSFAEAAVSSICEVIERDAFTITWQARLDRPQIRLDTLSDRNRELVSRFERSGHAVTLLNLTMDHGVATVLGVLRHQVPEAPALVFAASADPSPEQAVRKSLEELAHTRRLAQQLKRTLPRFVPGPEYNNVATQDDHVHFYTDHANAPLVDFIFSSNDRMAFGEIPDLATGDPEGDLTAVVQRIRGVGYQVLLVDLTTPDMAELGLTVVRAVIPGFHPLVIGHRLRALGGSRLWEVPQKLGYPGIRHESGDNPAPHPYP